MITRRGSRWGNDPKTGLPTIRRHPDAREYKTPEEVKQMIAGERMAVGGDGYYDDNDPRCTTCGGPAGLCEDE